MIRTKYDTIQYIKINEFSDKQDFPAVDIDSLRLRWKTQQEHLLSGLQGARSTPTPLPH